MPQVFISYSRKDKDFARKLADALTVRKLDCWVDWGDIRPTADWWLEVQRGIESSDIYLFVISPDSVKSKECRRELKYADGHGKRVVSVVARDTKTATAPLAAKRPQWIFFRMQDNFNQSLGYLINAINTNLEWVQAHTRLLQKALEWNANGRESSLLLHGSELKAARQWRSLADRYPDSTVTALQAEYLAVSSKIERQNRLILVSFSAATMIVVVLLVLFSLYQSRLASQRRATSIAAQATAQAEKARAEKQANISAARGLAEQARLLGTDPCGHIVDSTLLAAASLNVVQGIEADQLVRDNLDLLPSLVAQYSHENGGVVTALTYDPTGNLLASGDEYGGVKLWDVSTKRILLQLHLGDNITSIAFSPDGKSIVIGSIDGQAQVLDTKTGKELSRTLHTDYVQSVTFSHDGKLAASGGGDQSVHTWIAASGARVSTLKADEALFQVVFTNDDKYVVGRGRDHRVYMWDVGSGTRLIVMSVSGTVVAISSDGRYAISRLDSGAIQISDIKSGEELWHAPISSSSVRALFSSDNSLVVIGDNNGGISVANTQTGQQIAHFSIGGNVSELDISSDGRLMAARGLDNVARIWDLTSRQLVSCVTRDLGVVGVTFSSKGSSVAANDAFGNVFIFEMAAGNEVKRLPLGGTVYAGEYSPDGTKIAVVGCSGQVIDDPSACIEGEAKVWNVSSGEELSQLQEDGLIDSVAFSADSNEIVVGGWDGTARVWDVFPGKEIARMVHEARVFTVAFSPDGQWVASGGFDKTARIWNPSTAQELARIGHTGSIYTLAFSPNGRLLASGGYDGIIIVWDLQLQRKIASMSHDGFIYALTFSPAGNRILSGSYDYTARIWDTLSGEEITQLEHGGFVNTIAFSPSENLVLTGSWDGTARTWDALNGKEIARVEHQSKVNSVAFTPDGKWALSGGDDGVARVWDPHSGEEVARTNFGSPVRVVAFSPDGRLVYSGGADGVGRIWVWQASDMIQAACARLPRNLYQVEWSQYFGDIPYQKICPGLPTD